MLPDFVCNEKVTSTELDGDNVIREKVVESLFTGVQRTREANRVHFAFTESREVQAIDGKPVPRGTPFPKLPYRFGGGYSSLISSTFAPDNLPVHNYTLGDTYRSAESTAVLVRFTTKPNQQKLRGIIQGKELVEKDKGAAWIDPKTFQVLRLQRQSLNLPPGLTRSIATVDYGAVKIGDSTFWMPLHIRAEINEQNSKVTLSYIAEYSNCHKFMAEVKFD